MFNEMDEDFEKFEDADASLHKANENHSFENGISSEVTDVEQLLLKLKYKHTTDAESNNVVLASEDSTDVASCNVSSADGCSERATATQVLLDVKTTHCNQHDEMLVSVSSVINSLVKTVAETVKLNTNDIKKNEPVVSLCDVALTGSSQKAVSQGNQQSADTSKSPATVEGSRFPKRRRMPKKKSDEEKKEEPPAPPVPKEKVQLNETPVLYNLGDLVWSYVPGHPLWPCMLTNDPLEPICTKMQGGARVAYRTYHVQFLGDSPEHGWVRETKVFPYTGPSEYEEIIQKLSLERPNSKVPRLEIPPRLKDDWTSGMEEIIEATEFTQEERITKFAYDFRPYMKKQLKQILLNKPSLEITPPLAEASNNAVTKVPESSKSSKKPCRRSSQRSRRNSAKSSRETLKDRKILKRKSDQTTASVEELQSPLSNKELFACYCEKRRGPLKTEHPELTPEQVEALIWMEWESLSPTNQLKFGRKRLVPPPPTIDGSAKTVKSNNGRPFKNLMKKYEILKAARQDSRSTKQGFRCSFCKVSYQSKVSLSQHKRWCTGNQGKDKPTIVRSRAQPKTAAPVQIAEETTTECKFKCEHCHDKFYRKKALEIHKKFCVAIPEHLKAGSNIRRSPKKLLKITTSKTKARSKTSTPHNSPSLLIHPTIFNGTSKKKASTPNSKKDTELLKSAPSTPTRHKLSNGSDISNGSKSENDATPCSRRKSRGRGPQLGSTAKREVICTMCDSLGDGGLIACVGGCCQSFHLACIEGEKPKEGELYKCQNCVNQSHPCFICKKGPDDDVSLGEIKRCHVQHCGRSYHTTCLQARKLAIVDAAEDPGIGTNDRHSLVNNYRCTLHHCATCITRVSDQALTSAVTGNRMFRCVRCPTAYHVGDDCISAGSVILPGLNIICPDHFEPSKATPYHQPVHVSWCFLCSKGGELVCCEDCPAAFHPRCVGMDKPPEGEWYCRDCRCRRKPLFGDIVWVKLGSYRWWPGEITHPNDIPENIKNMRHGIGEFVVNFFGSNDYFWLNKRRVFAYQEGDTGASTAHCSRGISSVFNKALKEASQKFEELTSQRQKIQDVKTQKKRPQYKFIKVNKPVGNVQVYTADLNELPRCVCKRTDSSPCGPDSECLNRMLMFECHPALCRAGDKCQNQRFQKREYPDSEVFKTSWGGWGLKTKIPIKKGQFVNEYVGELVDNEECLRRIEYAHKNNITNFYMLTIDKDRIIDAGPKGNLSRFMNHCCDPGCETQKWTVNGDTRVGLFARRDIKEGEELTFNYNLDCLGNDKTPCMCGAENCSGFIGVRPKPQVGNGKNGDSKAKKKRRRTEQREMPKHDDFCFRCRQVGTLVCCDVRGCERAFCLSCLRLTKPPFGKWECPWHHCDFCGRRAQHFCHFCPNSFCTSHVINQLVASVPNQYDCCTDHDPNVAEYEMEEAIAAVVAQMSPLESWDESIEEVKEECVFVEQPKSRRSTGPSDGNNDTDTSAQKKRRQRKKKERNDPVVAKIERSPQVSVVEVASPSLSQDGSSIITETESDDDESLGPPTSSPVRRKRARRAYFRGKMKKRKRLRLPKRGTDEKESEEIVKPDKATKDEGKDEGNVQLV